MNGDKIIEALDAEKVLYLQLLNQFEEEMKHMPEGWLNCKVRREKKYFYQYLKTKDGKRIQKYLSHDDDHGDIV